MPVLHPDKIISLRKQLKKAKKSKRQPPNVKRRPLPRSDAEKATSDLVKQYAYRVSASHLRQR
jgi:hypothetical protein